MLQNIALKDDTTTHGGSLIGTGISFAFDGKPCVLCGEIFECPTHGTQTILEHPSNITIDGTYCALNGFLISCGAEILATSLSSAQEVPEIINQPP